MSSPYVGTDGRVDVDGVTLALREWHVKASAGDIDYTNFTSQGFEQHTGGLKKAEGSAKGFFDQSQNVMQDPPDITIGSVIGPVKFFVSSSLGQYWNFPLVLIKDVNMDNAVDGKVEYEFTFVTTGLFYYPGAIQA
jgi:hypothetical protein